MMTANILPVFMQTPSVSVRARQTKTSSEDGVSFFMTLQQTTNEKGADDASVQIDTERLLEQLVALLQTLDGVHEPASEEAMEKLRNQMAKTAAAIEKILSELSRNDADRLTLVPSETIREDLRRRNLAGNTLRWDALQRELQMLMTMMRQAQPVLQMTEPSEGARHVSKADLQTFVRKLRERLTLLLQRVPAGNVSLSEGKPSRGPATFHQMEPMNRGTAHHTQRPHQQTKESRPSPKSFNVRDVALSAFRRIGQTGEMNKQPSSSLTLDSGPMPRLQQFVLHVRPGSGAAQEQQFVREFQQILAKSTLTNTGGRQMLTIRLHPEHLGTLDIQLVRRDGQMTATLLTSTTAAKHLIESHLHQLQGAFASQNIHVDRLHVLTPYTGATAEHGAEDGDAREESQGEQHGNDDQMNDEGDEEAPRFSDWLDDDEE